MSVPAEEIPAEVVEAAQQGLERRTTRIADFRVRDLLAAVFDELAFPPDFFDLPAELDVCRPVEVDGETMRVRGERPLTEEGQAAFTSVVRAAKRRLEAEKAAERAEIERQVRAKVAEELEAQLTNYPTDVFPEPTGDGHVPDIYAASAMRTAYTNAARIARGES